MWIYIIIFAIILLIIVLKNKIYEPFQFRGACLYYTPFNKYRDPYSIFYWRDAYKRHRRWNNLHRIDYVPYSKLYYTVDK